MEQDDLYKVAMTMIPKVGAITARNLISYCGGLEAVFRARKKELCYVPGVGQALADQILNSNALEMAEQEMYVLEKEGIRPIFYLDKDYPERLRPYTDSPLLLYYQGTQDLNALRMVAIIGTRKPNPYSIHICEELVEGLKPYQVTTISGLAYGVDVSAHRKSLQLKIPTIGVLAHGLSQIYPASHRQIASQMMRGGGLLTEYPSHISPKREHFPMRNRIVAGLCDALVVVETGKEGGSMITAQFANDYNKDVFAFPGRVKDPHAAGGNYLIKSHRAALIERAEDLAYIMGWEEESFTAGVQQQLFVELSSDEKLVVDLLHQNEGASIDKLTYESRMTGSCMAAILLNLEFKGLIRSLPGKRYMLM